MSRIGDGCSSSSFSGFVGAMLWPADVDHPHSAELLAVCAVLRKSQPLVPSMAKHSGPWPFSPPPLLLLYLPTGIVGMETKLSGRLAVKEVEESSFIT